MNFIKNEKGNVNIKLLIFIIVLILIIIFGIVGIIIINKNKPKVVESIAEEPFEYFALFTLKDTVGVINKEGNLIIDSKYSEIYIPNQSKDVFFCFDKDDNCKILNSKGEELFTNYEFISTLTISDIALSFEKNVLVYEENGKYGLINFEGEKLTQPIYDEISSLKNKPGCISVKRDDLYGVLDSNGKIIIEAKYNSVRGDEFSDPNYGYTKTGYIVSEKTDTGIIYGYIDYNGKIRIEPTYESLSRVIEGDTDDIYLIFMENGKKGVIKNEKVIIKPRYQTVNYYDVSNVFIVNRNSKYGFIDRDGETILDADYTSYSIAENYISVKKDDTMMLFDLHGNLVNTNNYKSILETGNPAYFIAVDENGYYSIISKEVQIGEEYTQITYAYDNFFVFTNKEGKSGVLDVYTGIEINPIYDSIIVIENARCLEAISGTQVDIYSENIEKIISMDNGIIESVNDEYTEIYSDKEIVYFDLKGNIVSNKDVYPDLNIYSFKGENDKWGFKDKNDNVVLEPQYDMITEVNEYGYAGIYNEGKWGIIDKDGKIVEEPTYTIDTYYSPKFIGKYLVESIDNVHCIELSEK